MRCTAAQPPAWAECGKGAKCLAIAFFEFGRSDANFSRVFPIGETEELGSEVLAVGSGL